MKNELYLWRFYIDGGRAGALEWLFSATQDEIDEIWEQNFCFHEVLGKFSEIYGVVCKENLTKLPISAAAVKEITNQIGNVWCGENLIENVKEHMEVVEYESREE